jgi:hypothetical protein
VDLNLGIHRQAVLSWLRAWGCRQFVHEYQDLSSSSLRDWASEWVPRLPNPQVQLVELTEQEMEVGSAAYDDLRMRPASYSHRRSGMLHLKRLAQLVRLKPSTSFARTSFPHGIEASCGDSGMKRAARSIDAIYPALLSSSTNSQGILEFRFHNFLGRLGAQSLARPS